MNRLILPDIPGDPTAQTLPLSRQITVVGGAGAGKTRFIQKLMELNSDKAFSISAIGASFPSLQESDRPGSIDALYRKAIERQPYLKGEAVSEIDKLIFMLIADEIDSLLSLKRGDGGNPRNKGGFSPTRLDSLIRVWQELFPGNRIVMEQGMMMFATQAGNNLIPAAKLSRSEQTALYYCAATLFAPAQAVIFVDSPSLFLHPTVVNPLWNKIERLRRDCTFVYDSVDVDFVNSRTRNTCIWVKQFDSLAASWDYEIMADGDLREDMFIDLIGSRRPVLFIEGDIRHSIDARLYPLVFPDFTVKPLGSCDKVIETVRGFTGLRHMHHLESRGIVDRDRRTDKEVGYLRDKGIMVADVAEVENIFMLEEVIKTMARRRGKNPEQVFAQVKRNVCREFASKYKAQALQHVRYRVKREVECKIDARFTCITAMELHLNALPSRLRPREQYDDLCRQFSSHLEYSNYAAIIKVFNHKPMLGECGPARALDYKNKDEYVAGVLSTLKEGGEHAKALRHAIRHSFKLE